MDRWPHFIRRTALPFGARRRGLLSALSTCDESAHFDGRRFRNLRADTPLSIREALAVMAGALLRGRVGKPGRPVPLSPPQFPGTASGLSVTWLGHASVLLEIDGARVLADPMFSDRASPAQWIGPRRLHPAPVAPATLPELTAIVISHDHYDHLDYGTIMALADTGDAPFLVPRGVGAHLDAWGIPAGRIVELDWGGQCEIGGVTMTCTPARHFSGRTLRRNSTLWSSWSLAGPTRRVFFGGDTGYTSQFSEIAADYGPFDLTVLPIGAYDAAWPDIHMTPEQALRAHRDLNGSVLLPIHWATFDLARHSWAEPIDRLLAACDGETVVVPRPGQRVTVDPRADIPGGDRWWRAVTDGRQPSASPKA